MAALKHLVDQASASTDRAMLSTRRIIHDTLDALSDTVRDFRDEVAHTLNHTGAIAHHGAHAVCEGSRHLRDKARDTANSAIDCIRDEPVKAALMAWPRMPAIAGIAFLWGRPRHGRWSKVRWGVGNHSA